MGGVLWSAASGSRYGWVEIAMERQQFLTASRRMRWIGAFGSLSIALSASQLQEAEWSVFFDRAV